ncbi:hypothetical protein MKX01_015014 [Papaver californicum]|nr:hypothetical protein MKX01_015014 [Papaver californicum]
MVKIRMLLLVQASSKSSNIFSKNMKSFSIKIVRSSPTPINQKYRFIPYLESKTRN